VERLYVGLNPSLRRAAGRSVLAHLIDLIGRDIVTADGPSHSRGAFPPAPQAALKLEIQARGRRHQSLSRNTCSENDAPRHQPLGFLHFTALVE